MIRLKCPGCGVSLKIPDSFAGKKSPCPKCRRVVQIPAAEEPEPVVEEEEQLEKAEDEEAEEEVPEEEEPEERAAPKRAGKKSAKPAADEEEEEAPEDEAEEEEKPPPKRKGKKPVRRAKDEEDEEDEEEEEDKPRRKKGRGAPAKGSSLFTRNRISGAIGVLLGLAALGFGLGTGISGGEWGYYQIIGVVFGVVLLGAGVFYIVKS